MTIPISPRRKGGKEKCTKPFQPFSLQMKYSFPRRSKTISNPVYDNRWKKKRKFANRETQPPRKGRRAPRQVLPSKRGKETFLSSNQEKQALSLG